MKFKKIELYGFKSFADKLEIKFSDGITGIVGPNGCGKSNVADSMRWVLGEQSAKLLRGSSMQDVIFNGTENRKSMSYCEVSLFFDNKEKLFPSLDYEEVIISRKLYRDGTSEYSINRTPCRLKDLSELLRDGGIGREGYSIIGQGRIDELLSAKPEDRRAIFEEAAGISKYKVKKIDAERKLDRTQDNLIRINDILEEKQKQLEPLYKQSVNAKKWLDMRDVLKDNEINAYIHQYETASEAKQVISNRINGLAENINKVEGDYNTSIAIYNDSREKLNNLDQDMENLRQKQLELKVGLETKAGDVKVLKERVSNLFEQNKSLQEQNAELTDNHNDFIGEIEKLTLSLDKKNAEFSSSSELVEQLKDQYLACLQKINQGEEDAQASQKAMIDAMGQLSEIKANMSRLLAERQGLSQNLQDNADRLDANKTSLDKYKTSLNEVNNEIKTLDYSKQSLLEKGQAISAEYESLNDEIVNIASDLDRKNAKFYTLKSRHKILLDLQQAFEGYAYSIKNVMNDAKTNTDLSSRIEGVVAQMISMDPMYETAMETALGASMQNIVTKTDEDAKYIIEYLKKMNYGRITFLPMSAIRPRRIEDEYKVFLSQSGCYGIASELVKYDAKYDNIFKHLLGATVIVDNMDTAIHIARATGYTFKIVTLDGDVINPHGSITGGAKKKDIANIFSHDRELKELTVVLEQLSKDLDKTTKSRDDKAKRLEEVTASLTKTKDELHLLELELASKTETKNQLADNVNSLDSNIAELELDSQDDQKRLDEINAEINRAGELEALIAEKQNNAQMDESQRKQASDEIKKQSDELREKFTDERLKNANINNDIKAIQNDIERYQGQANDCVDKIENNGVLIAENKKVIDTIEKEMNACSKTTSEEDRAELANIEKKLSGLDDYKDKLQDNITKSDKNRIDLMNELQDLREKRAKENMLLLKVDTDIEQMEQRILEEYNLDYKQCLEFRRDDFDIKVALQEIDRLKRSMRALGNVNLESIDLYKEVSASYEEMNAQKEDLVKAEDDLNKIIKELSTEMLDIFNVEFEKIRVNYCKIFKELFNGGRADLVLLENENPLERGIEIVAQPPEKTVHSISLLSGGERALTAIAILFAILKLKPMPFCLLDEIEAALDDENAKRFAKYLHRFSQETQFIVITHRKPTMELADNLYGVTMEEKGVSKIVSVNLSDAVAAVEKEQQKDNA